jgi:archaellum biogenesis protein FlaJ (TadC family)
MAKKKRKKYCELSKVVKIVKKLSKKLSNKLSKSCQIYQKVGCKKTKILKRVGEEGEGEGDL